MLWTSPRLPCLTLGASRQAVASIGRSRRLASSVISPCHSIASVLSLARAGDLKAAPRSIQVTGHVRTIRNQKRRSFLELGDGSTTSSLQALLDPDQAAGLGTGTSVKITGLWQPCPPGKEQTHELHAQTVEILGAAGADTYPIQKKYHSSEFLRTIPHLRLRVPFNALLARLRSDCDHYASNYFRTNHYVRTHPPIITSSDCEGAGEVFTVQPRQDDNHGIQSNGKSLETKTFFGRPKYLTVSSQLHLEAYVHEHPRVWTLSPTFRAEKSDTPRHLSEFYMLEAELRTDNLEEVMDCVENLVRHIATEVHSSVVGKELLNQDHEEEEKQEKNEKTEKIEVASLPRAEKLRRRWTDLKRLYWPRVSYTNAMGLLQAAEASGEVEFRYKPDWHSGLQLEHEKFITSEIGQGSPVFVTDYPESVKPFYMTPSEGEDSTGAGRRTVACFDLLLPDLCEVVGGSLREHRLTALEKSMTEHGLLGDDSVNPASKSSLEWYLELRRYGSVPHGGFGLGFDRLMSYLAGVDNVRDVVPWPRYYGRCDG